MDEVLLINPFANVLVFGDFNVHHKDWLTYSGVTDRPGELCYKLSISNDLTQITILVLIGMVSVIIREMFNGRISLNSVLLLLLVNFVRGFRLDLMYISLIVCIRLSLTHPDGFIQLVLLP